MNSEMVWMIIGMGAVTYISRLAPFLLFHGRELPSFIQGVLKNVPYATLGALIFPGVLFISEDIWFGLLGAAFAFVAAYLGANVIIVVLGSILILSGYSFLFS
ncbi:branched chain amino acid efflux pump [Cytobacillus horneckiae]|uniref:AzlD domain-containing protein n=1 Tax=Cytobacillus horneckiae TaxID=549687 RepID=A0A2N0Z928_9BACI|nr:AzlD domain-containing protein [Cytobacillus horneckiae]NRG47183.1 AzlD domain-containing protein [Bacillus sp. CRN 9]MBN6887607.1 AzlD domain-containing protein [Cytobacillus horneckiae]MCM3178666.1 AzlD domain-containing protein [Cytobacillus horneckiae]MEC1157598.1 AzlD domain-containing protein [Cytobacillus horneckiae]MED2939247.1 AzlD domain-containing protein [Cytobacillus horneckiae]